MPVSVRALVEIENQSLICQPCAVETRLSLVLCLLSLCDNDDAASYITLLLRKHAVSLFLPFCLSLSTLFASSQTCAYICVVEKPRLVAHFPLTNFLARFSHLVRRPLFSRLKRNYHGFRHISTSFTFPHDQ